MTPTFDKGKAAGKRENMKRNKSEYIKVVMYCYGMTKKEALQYIKTATPELLEELRKEYRAECKKNFYSD